MIYAEIPDDEDWSLSYGCMDMAFCKDCYERNKAEHPDFQASNEPSSEPSREQSR